MVEIGNYRAVSNSEVVGDNGITCKSYGLQFIRLTRASETFWLVREGGFGPGPNDAGDIIYLDTAYLTEKSFENSRELTPDEQAFWKPNIEAIYRAKGVWCQVQTSDPCLTVTSPISGNKPNT